MSLKIEYKDSRGRKHSDMAGLLDAETERIVDSHLGAMKRVMESQRCEIHGEYPTVSLNKVAGKASFDITGCCERLIERAEAAASNV
jgi:hypothetical protein